MNIEQKAAEMRERLGGTIFAFPIDGQDPFSKYALVVYVGGQYHVYPEAEHISGAAVGVHTLLELLQKDGFNVNYEKDVRFVSYQAQIDAPDVTMRRLKKDNGKPLLEEGVDLRQIEDGDALSAQGLIKVNYFEMMDSKNPKAKQFMEGYYKLLASRKYGKTASAIRQEVNRMSKQEASKWIERTYQCYVYDDKEIGEIFNSLSK